MLIAQLGTHRLPSTHLDHARHSGAHRRVDAALLPRDVQERLVIVQQARGEDEARVRAACVPSLPGPAGLLIYPA